ncbi:MAG: hypothetical protein AAFR42_05480 [Cyanobacteria bacterium J06628_6]
MPNNRAKIGVGLTLISIYLINQRAVLVKNVRQISQRWGLNLWSAPDETETESL